MPRMHVAEVDRAHKAPDATHAKAQPQPTVELAKVAQATAYLIDQRVLAEDSFRKSLLVWAKKHHADNALVMRMAHTLTLEQARGRP